MFFSLYLSRSRSLEMTKFSFNDISKLRYRLNLAIFFCCALINVFVYWTLLILLFIGIFFFISICQLSQQMFATSPRQFNFLLPFQKQFDDIRMVIKQFHTIFCVSICEILMFNRFGWKFLSDWIYIIELRNASKRIFFFSRFWS